MLSKLKLKVPKITNKVSTVTIISMWVILFNIVGILVYTVILILLTEII